MYFKGIEMRGFKSFVDETALRFEPGITAIVGPNGCGKSNIADAIRWVLGEQSAKHMRGGKMEDFIFNGSGRRKQAGFAEVSVTMVNDDGKITTMPFAEYPEVTVTRKLYRSGESEYYINKVPCRLKDIVDLFLDTGISTRSLSIIEQGQVTAIVNSRPEDRRGLIEEAAGVMKYKARRNAALNKLAAAQQNLLRIQDLLGELERQRNSLSRQAKKAERFMGFRTEIREKAHDWYANEYQMQKVKLTGMEATLSAAREKETIVSAEVSTRRNRIENLSGRIGVEERALGEKKEERYQLTSAIEKNESHIELLTRQLSDLGRIREEAEVDIARLEEEKVRIGGDREGRLAEVAQLDREIAVAVARKEDLDEESKNVRQRLAGKQDELARLQRENMDLMRRLSEAKNRQGQLTTRIEMADNRLSGLTARREEAAQQVGAFTESVARITEELAAAQANAATERETHQRLTEELSAATARLDQASASLRDVEDQITRVRSRLDSLEELERNMEGFGEGVKGLMKLANDGTIQKPSGLLADGLRIAPAFETALAAALGERLEAAMLTDEASVAEAVRLLREGAVGRAILLAGDMVETAADTPTPDHPSLVGRASDLVTFTDAAPQAARRALASIFVAKDLADGMEIWRQHPGAYGVVTLDGDLIDADGFVTGGGKPAGQGAAIVARKRIIEELTGELAGLEGRRSDAATVKEEGVAAVEKAKQEVTASAERLRSFDMAALSAGKEEQGRRADLERSQRGVESLDREAEQLDTDRAKLVDEEKTLAEAVATVETEKNERDGQVESASAEIEEYRRSLESVTGRVREEEIALTETRGRLTAAKVDIQRIESVTADLTARVERLVASRGENARRKEEMERSIEEMRGENVELAKRQSALQEEVTRMTEALTEEIGERDRLEQEGRELAQELETLRAAIAEEAVKANELTLRVENIVEKADHEFNIPVEDLKDRDLSEVDLEETGRRLSFLRGEISRIGDVNMTALEEFEEINGRYEFMKTQHTDLVSSIAT